MKLITTLHIASWFLLIALWFGMVGYYKNQILISNREIMAKVEHLEEVMLCNPIDLSEDFGTKMLDRKDYPKE